jgi:hypothetical protein
LAIALEPLDDLRRRIVVALAVRDGNTPARTTARSMSGVPVA